MHSLFNHIQSGRKRGKKFFAVLIDPDKFNPEVVREANQHLVDFLFIGGSGKLGKRFHRCIGKVKEMASMPLIIFPGGKEQISNKADALLLLSLISGRNPDYLIGEHIQAALRLRRSGLEIIPTGYILVNGGTQYTTRRLTRTKPIRHTDHSLAVHTAVAGELLGLKMIYLESGSGARRPIEAQMLRRVRSRVSAPLIVGGGIDSGKKAVALCQSGADVIVAGNSIEKDLSLLGTIASAIRDFNRRNKR